MPQPLDFVKIYRVWYHIAEKFGRKLNLAVLAVPTAKLKSVSYIV